MKTDIWMCRYGERCWFRKDLHTRRSSSSRSQSHLRVLDARLGPMVESSRSDPPVDHLQLRQRQPSVLQACHTVDIPRFLRHSSRRYLVAHLLSILQDEICVQTTASREEEAICHWLRRQVIELDLLIFRPSRNRDCYRMGKKYQNLMCFRC